MWLKNDILKVYFDERRGGMPVRDSFGFIKVASVEIARVWPPPFFQSLNERNPRIKKHGDSGLTMSGAMKKGGENNAPHLRDDGHAEGEQTKLVVQVEGHGNGENHTIQDMALCQTNSA